MSPCPDCEQFRTQHAEILNLYTAMYEAGARIVDKCQTFLEMKDKLDKIKEYLNKFVNNKYKKYILELINNGNT